MTYMLLADLRKNANLTPQQAARQLGISPSTLYRHERGLSQLTPLVLRGYGCFYGVDWTLIEQARP